MLPNAQFFMSSWKHSQPPQQIWNQEGLSGFHHSSCKRPSSPLHSRAKNLLTTCQLPSLSQSLFLSSTHQLLFPCTLSVHLSVLWPVISLLLLFQVPFLSRSSPALQRCLMIRGGDGSVCVRGELKSWAEEHLVLIKKKQVEWSEVSGKRRNRQVRGKVCVCVCFFPSSSIGSRLSCQNRRECSL